MGNDAAGSSAIESPRSSRRHGSPSEPALARWPVGSGSVPRGLNDSSAATSRPTIDLAARYAAVLGHQLAASVYPFGDPVRDRAQLALIGRFRPRLHRSIRVRTEVAIPIAGDPRSADAVLGGAGWDAVVEAETRIGDFQLVERKARARQRDLGADRLILLVGDTPNDREVLRLHPERRERFPVDTRTCLRRLRDGTDPGGDCLVIM